MSVETRPVPCNIMAWPRVRDMITQQKAIYVYLWHCPDSSAGGCFLFSIDRSAADLSMSPNSLDDALDEFVRRKLIVRDKETGELYIVDWPRFHRFSTPAARGALWASIGKIQSINLRDLAEKAYKSIPLPSKGKDKGKDKNSSIEEESAGMPAVASPEASVHNKKTRGLFPFYSHSGILCWTDKDTQEAEKLELKHGVEMIEKVVQELDSKDIHPLPSRVMNAILNTRSLVAPNWRSSDRGIEEAARKLNLTAYLVSHTQI